MKNYVCVTKCCSKLIYQTLPDKQVVYVLPSMITSILGRLPVVQAGYTGTIQFKYRTRCSNCAHRYGPDTLARADSRPWAGDGCSMHLVNSWATWMPVACGCLWSR